jgi:phosphate:Na+ symporter
VDDRLLSAPAVALMQVKKEMDYMFALVEENIALSFADDLANGEKITENEAIIDFINSALTRFLIKLSAVVDQSSEHVIGAYFHVLNDLERVGDHAENFYEITQEMAAKKFVFSETGRGGVERMRNAIMQMLAVARDVFDNLNRDRLPELSELEDSIDGMKRELTAHHFARLADGNCNIEVSPYFSSTVAGLERVADHLVNVGYSIVSPVGSQKE